MSDDKDKERIDALVDEFQAYCDSHGLPQLSADELLWELEGEEREKHRAYLIGFIERWEKLMDDIYGG